MRIIVIDLNIGNIKSLLCAINFLGLKSKLSNERKEISNATHLVLTGVGSFDSAMDAIKKLDLKNVLIECVIKKKIPILGICIGMQIFFDKSDEGKLDGLSFLKGKISKLKKNKTNDFKVPNVGFRKIFYNNNFTLFKDLKEPYFYFTHSYAAQLELGKSLSNYAECKHEKNFLAAIQKENIFGVQFHPEKSQSSGLRILANFFKNK